MKFIIGNDHAGPESKVEIIKYLESKNYEFEDCGVAIGERADYPDIAKIVAEKVLADSNSLGVLICGTGVGMSIQANRYKGIRAAAVDKTYTAKLAKAHNNANVICFGERVISTARMIEMLDIFLKTQFEGETSEGCRHNQRIAKLDD